MVEVENQSIMKDAHRQIWMEQQVFPIFFCKIIRICNTRAQELHNLTFTFIFADDRRSRCVWDFVTFASK